MKIVSIPKILHDVLGEKQSIFELILLLIIPLALTLILYFNQIEIFCRVSWWRSTLAMVLTLDIFAGCIANLTQGTNDYYATRPVHRILFISIHVHILVIMGLLAEPLTPYFIIWGYTITAAFLVNWLKYSNHQGFFGGVLLTIGISMMPLIPGISFWGMTIAIPFMMKVLYSFAVDHYRQGKV